MWFSRQESRNRYDLPRFYTVTIHGKMRTGKSTLLSLFVREWFRGTPLEREVSGFKFDTASGPRSHTRGQKFVALRWLDHNNVFKGTVLLVDSEGTGEPARAASVGLFDLRLFSVARLQSQVGGVQCAAGERSQHSLSCTVCLERQEKSIVQGLELSLLFMSSSYFLALKPNKIFFSVSPRC